MVTTPASRMSAPIAVKPSRRAATRAGPEGRVSRPYTTLAGFDMSILADRMMVSMASMRSWVVEALAKVEACASQDVSSISPRGSTSLTPLSFHEEGSVSEGRLRYLLERALRTSSGLCDAVTITPMVFPSNFLLRKPARIPTRKRTGSNIDPLRSLVESNVSRQDQGRRTMS